MNMRIQTAITRQFGRLVHPDPRDLKFALTRPNSLEGLPSYKHWDTGPVLDQGMTSQCVAYAGVQWLAAGPVTNKPNASPETLYNECQKVDEWPGEDYDGTSVRALFKVLQKRGYVKSYGWAWDVATMLQWVLLSGPMVVGTTWYEGMMDTDRYDFIRATGYPVGGHAWVVAGVNRNTVCPDGSVGAFRMVNSWGRSWSREGRAWISFRDMQKLLDDAGEACTATEVKVRP